MRGAGRIRAPRAIVEIPLQYNIEHTTSEICG
jgi:hypothetical protein